MNKSLSQLLERMRASREAIAQQLNLLPWGSPPRTVTGERMRITWRQIGMAMGAILAIRFLFSRRHGHKGHKS